MSFELLSTRRPTRVDELYKAVPKPAGGVPKHGLPIWSDLHLDAKLPVIKAPKGALVFSRGKVGEKIIHSNNQVFRSLLEPNNFAPIAAHLSLDADSTLPLILCLQLWRRPAAQNFNLYDPNGYEVTYHYDALHDGNLRRLLAQEGLQRRLKELGLITDNGEAVCSLKQLNEYRRYLKRLHLDSLNQERQHRDELERERQILENAQRYADKERMILDKNSLRKEKMDNNRAKLEEERLEKEQMLAARRRRHAQRIKQIARRKLEDALRRRERSLALDQKVLSRVLMANEIERRRKIHMMRRWHDGETRRLQLREQRRRQELRDRECREAERWQQKLEEQLDYKKRREELLTKHEQQMEFLVDVRNYVVNQQRLQLELALQDIKHRRNKQKRDKNARQRSTAMLNAMSKAWDGHCNNLREVSKPDVKTALASTMNIMKHKGQGQSSLIFKAESEMDVWKSFANNEISLYQNHPLESSLCCPDTLAHSLVCLSADLRVLGLIPGMAEKCITGEMWVSTLTLMN
ncbi:unnamed protein product [Timema podura]|uniref:Uncharacterized protein n=1 Tax=Timema podura TaxID=61482 RepID=A0ABN7NN19_TIMPD|nr:unnamed protein product [Timema podura]